MGLKNIVQQIIDEAKEKADAITQEGMKEAEKILKEKQEELTELRKAFDEETRKLSESIIRKATAMANFELKNSELRARRDAINTAFDKAQQELVDSPAAKRKRIIKALLMKAEKDLKVKYVQVNRKDKDIVPSSYEVTESAIPGGIIVENADRTVSIDLSLPTVFETIKQQKVEAVSEML